MKSLGFFVVIFMRRDRDNELCSPPPFSFNPGLPYKEALCVNCCAGDQSAGALERICFLGCLVVCVLGFFPLSVGCEGGPGQVGGGLLCPCCRPPRGRPPPEQGCYGCWSPFKPSQ